MDDTAKSPARMDTGRTASGTFASGVEFCKRGVRMPTPSPTESQKRPAGERERKLAQRAASVARARDVGGSRGSGGVMRSGRELRRGLATTTGPSEAERSASRRRRREHGVARSVRVISVRREVASRSRFSPPRAVGRADGELQPRDAWPHEEKFGQRSYRAPRRDRLAGWGGSGGRGPAKRVTRSRAVHRRRIERAFGSSSSRTVGGRPTGRTRRSRGAPRASGVRDER